MDTHRKFHRLSECKSPVVPFHRDVGIPTYRISNLTLFVYVGLEMVLLAVGLALTAFAIMWMDDNPMHRMVLGDGDLAGVLLIGAMFITTFLISLPGLLHAFTLSPRKIFSTMPLDILCIALALDQLAVAIVGTMIWWRTLQERATFFRRWESSDVIFQSALQAKFSCCGYYACARGPETTVVCVDPITKYADSILGTLFTCVYATSTVVIPSLLSSIAVIAEIKLLNRYRKIDLRCGRLEISIA